MPTTPSGAHRAARRAAPSQALRQAPKSSNRATLAIALGILGLVGVALVVYALTRPAATPGIDNDLDGGAEDAGLALAKAIGPGAPPDPRQSTMQVGS